MKKIIKNKKTWLSFLTISAVVAPVAAVISCSKATFLNDEEAETNSRLAKVGPKIERTYQEQLLTKLNTGDTSKSPFAVPYRKLKDKAEWDSIIETAAKKSNGTLNFLVKQIAGVNLSDDIYKPLKNSDSNTNLVAALKSLVANDDAAKTFGYSVEDINTFLQGNITSTDNKGNRAYLNVEDLVKYYIQESVFTNRNFLKTLGSTLITLDESKLVTNDKNVVPVADENGNYPKITYADIAKYGLLQEIPTDGIPKITINGKVTSLYDSSANAIFDELIKTLIKSNYSDFINGMYKFFISINYFNTTKADWEKVYHDNANFNKYYREYQTVESEIAPENFLITKEVIKDKPFFSWTASLDENSSKQFLSTTPKKTIDEVDAFMGARSSAVVTPPTLPNAISPLSVPYSTEHKRISSYQANLLSFVSGETSITSNNSMADNIFGYAGLTKQAPVGSESLSFTQSKMESATGTEIDTKKAFTDLVDQIKNDRSGINKLANIIAQLKGTKNANGTPTDTTGAETALQAALDKKTANIVAIDSSKIDAVKTALKALATSDSDVLSWNYVDLSDAYTNGYNGYLFKNEVKQNDIQLIADGAKVVSLNKLIGVMPSYVNGQFKMAQFNTVDKITSLKEELYFLDSKDIYDDALTYYTNRPGDKILLTISDNYLRTLATDTWGYNFIDKDGSSDNNNN